MKNTSCTRFRTALPVYAFLSIRLFGSGAVLLPNPPTSCRTQETSACRTRATEKVLLRPGRQRGREGGGTEGLDRSDPLGIETGGNSSTWVYSL